ncbi:MAG: hypothetical protein H0U67_00255, partial [Gemmatimonadetes bacterium]|nr:hypothetical protein [Gemmatimonadota bacterium]
MRYRARLPVVLLSLALLLAAVLAYKAQAAARSHRATAERALHDYAEFATWAYAEHAQRSLLTVLISSMVRAVVRVDPDLPPSALPTPDSLAAWSAVTSNWCDCLDQVRFWFRYDWRDGSLVTHGQTPSREMERWVRDTMLVHSRSLEASAELRPLTYGSAGRDPLRRLGILLTNDSWATVFGRQEGRDRMLGFVISRDLEGKPLVTYGFETEAASFVEPVLRD